jgi:uncharacterized protein
VRHAVARDHEARAPDEHKDDGHCGDERSIGRDELVVDAAGNSTIPVEDFAVALLDDAERPKHPRMRFTVAY